MTRRDRILLLLDSYLDVIDMQQRAGNEAHRTGKPGYRHLVRRGLWDKGSYAQLERCITRLRAHYPRLGRHLTAQYLGSKGMAGHEINPARVQRAVDLLEHWMPENVNIPVELLENAEIRANPAALTYLRRKAAA